jgi:hypothetical protein
MAPRTGLVLALVAAVLIMGQFASLVEGNEVPLDDCTLTDVVVNGETVKTLVIANDITIIPHSFCEEKCSGKGIQAIDFRGADALTEIGSMAFGNLWSNPACWELAGTLDLSNLPNLKYIAPYAFHNSKKITAVDISNCEKLHHIGSGAFANNVHNPETVGDWGYLKSFVAQNVGTKSLDDHPFADSFSLARDETADGPFAGALIFAPMGWYDIGGDTLTLLDFRGTALGSGSRAGYSHESETYPTKQNSGYGGQFQYGDRLHAFKGPFDVFDGTESQSQYATASLSYRKCEVIDGTVNCCDDTNGNTFVPKVSQKANHGYMHVGFKPDTPERFTPDVITDIYADNGACPPPPVDCAGSWSGCTSACEAAADRTWVETTAMANNGEACPAAGTGPDCANNDGDCQKVDCAGSWSDCTSVCEAATDRTWTETTPKEGVGADCLAAEDCGDGDGTCVSTDCAGTWSDCSESCEAAADRTWTVTTPKAGLGLACPAAGSGPNCAVGDGNCTSIGLQGQSSQTSVAMFPAMAAMILASAIALLCTAG